MLEGAARHPKPAQPLQANVPPRVRPALQERSEERGLRRLRIFCRGLLVAFFFVLIVAAMLGTGVSSLLFCTLAFVFCAVTYTSIRDPISYLLVTHPCWMFVFTALLYSDIQGQNIDVGLYDAATSLTIVAWYQFAVALAFTVAAGIRIVQEGPISRENSGGAIATPTLVWILLGSTAITVAPAVIGKLSFLLSLSSFGLTIVWISAAYLLQRSGEKVRAAITVAALALGAGMSVSMNQRAWLLSALLFSVCFVLFYVRRPVTVRNLAIVALGGVFLTVFSGVTLEVRARGAQESVTSSAAMYADALVSPATWARMLDPASRARPLMPPPKQGRLHAFVTNFYREGSGGLLERITLLPQLDIVATHLGVNPSLRLDEVANLFRSVAPNVGQEKDTIYSDRLVWELGLRRITVVARPMITAAGEFYSMGGVGVLMFVVFPLFSLIFIQLMHIRARTSFTNYAFMAMISSIYFVFSSTALSVTAIAVRDLPFLLVLVWFYEKPRTRAQATSRMYKHVGAS